MDIFTKKKRSQIMSLIRSESKLEKDFRKTLSRKLYPRGIRYRINYKKIPGSPDIAFVSRKIAIFIDGDFWHGYKFDKRTSKLPKRFWQTKIESNIKRDQRNRRILKKMGWRYVRVWEHEIKKHSTRATVKIIKLLKLRIN